MPLPSKPLRARWNPEGGIPAAVRRGLRVSATVALALALFLGGQTAGGTLAYFTYTLQVTSNTFSTAAAFRPSVLSPSAAVSTTATSYTVTGTASANALVKIYTASPLTLLDSAQLEGNITDWSFNISLSTTGAYNLVVTQTISGTESTQTTVPTITRVDQNKATTTGSLLLDQTASDTVEISASFTNDSGTGNTAGTASYAYCVVGSTCPTYSGGGSMTRTAPTGSPATGSHSASLASLTSGTTYSIRVTYSDSDGVVGLNPLYASVTIGQGSSDRVRNVSVSPNPFAPAAEQYTEVTWSLTGPDKPIILQVLDGSGSVIRTLVNCVDDSTITKPVQWDGRNASNVLQSNGSYTFQIRKFSASGCTSTAEEVNTMGVTISNPASIAMSPESGAPAVTPGTCVQVTATVLNSQNQPVSAGKGLKVNWAYSQASGTGTGSFTTTSCAAGTSTRVTTTTSSGVSPSGAACTWCTSTTDPSPLYFRTDTGISATVFRITATSGTVTGTTTINDPPPDPPEDVQLSVGSLRVRWKPSPSFNTAGYLVYIGTRRGVAARVPHRGEAARAVAEVEERTDTVVDVEDATEYVLEPVTPGATYFVSVVGYNQDRVLGTPSREASLTIPLVTPTAVPSASPTPTATATTTPTPAASVTATPAATPSPSPTPTSEPTSQPTAGPTSTATVAPTSTPTVAPTSTPTPAPTATPTAAPSVQPAPTSTPGRPATAPTPRPRP